MNIITLDFESFYSDDYTPSKMTTESYIRDPRFEAPGCSVKSRSRGGPGNHAVYILVKL